MPCPSAGRYRRRRLVNERQLRAYLENAERVLKTLKVNRNALGLELARIEEAIDWARRYCSDARAFMERGDYVSSLAAVAYCEGILEALRLLCATSFSW